MDENVTNLGIISADKPYFK